MVSQLKRVCGAFDPIPDLTVIRTIWLSEKKDWSLPAVIVDYSRPIFDEGGENGMPLEGGDQFFFELAVKHAENGDPLATLEALEKKWIEVQAALAKAFEQNSISILNADVLDVTFGKQTALAFVCDIEIT